MKQTINELFWAAAQAHDRAKVKQLFSSHRDYLLKQNSPPKLLSTLCALDLSTQAFTLLHHPKSFYKRLNKNEFFDFKIAEIWFYLSQDCFHQAHFILDELSGQTFKHRLPAIYKQKGYCYFFAGDFKNANKFLLLALQGNEQLSKSFNFNYFLALSFIGMKDIDRARPIIEKVATLIKTPDEHNTYLLLECNYVELLPNYNTAPLIKRLQKIVEEQNDLAANAPFNSALGALAAKAGLKELAISAFQASLCRELNAPQSFAITVFKELIKLDAQLSLEDKVAAFCYPEGEAQDSAIYFAHNKTVHPWIYFPDKLRGEYVDLFAGRIKLKGKTHWLSPLQTKLLLAIVSSGSVGQHISNLEWLVFQSANTGELNNIKRLEKLLTTLKKFGLKFKRQKNFIYHEFAEDLPYVIPNNLNYQGPLGLLSTFETFTRKDLETLLGVKRSSATITIKNWLDEGKIKVIKTQKTDHYALTPFLSPACILDIKTSL